MPRKPVWKGSKAIHLQPDSPEFFDRGSTTGYRFVYKGPYRTLVANRPKKGDEIQGYPKYFVDEVTIKPDGAGADGPGTMSLTATTISGGDTESPEDQTVIEIDAGSLEKSIYAHPAFESIPKEDIALLKKALENKEPVPGPSLPGPLTEKLTKLAELLQRGTESFLVAAPIVRKTTTTATKPTVGAIGIGTRQTAKPHPSAPAGYEWLKTGDRAVQQGAKGKWERVQEWSGADKWDVTLYGPQT